MMDLRLALEQRLAGITNPDLAVWSPVRRSNLKNLRLLKKCENR